MKIETKLAFKYIQKNKKRALLTLISIILCVILILTTMLLISSIKNGINQIIETEYNDYHIVIRDANTNDFDIIKSKQYVENIYIKENDSEQIIEANNLPDITKLNNNFDIYIKYTNVKDVCKNSTDLINSLRITREDLVNKEEKIEFNQNLLTINGLIDVTIEPSNTSLICKARINYSYFLEIVFVGILIIFSIIFITILYNAFLITINERKKDYAILSSIGSTEKQILKMIFLEGSIFGIIGIIIGGCISVLCANIIIQSLNNVIVDTGYTIKLTIKLGYIILAILIIILNIYLSAIIPSIKASTTSVIQNIRNNKQIKYNRKNYKLEKVNLVEAKLALRSIKRNRNKYRIIVILLVVCMISFIIVNTYVNYEKLVAELVNIYDVDAELHIDSKLNTSYKYILDNYEKIYNDNIEYIEYKITGLNVLAKPKEAIKTNNVINYKDGKSSLNMVIIGLDNEMYNEYLNEIQAEQGDIIVYNNTTKINKNEETVGYSYSTAFNNRDDLEFDLIATNYNFETKEANYKIIESNALNGNIRLTNILLEGFLEIKTKYLSPAIFINMDRFNMLQEEIDKYEPQNNYIIDKWIWNDAEVSVKVKCNNIIEFSNYIEDVMQKLDIEINNEYYTLESKWKSIYINAIELILNVILIAIITIGIISNINISNASLLERKKELNMLYSIGATKGNINKILRYECFYIFVKATIISIIISIPILYYIIKYMENIIALDKLFIPYKSIILFIIVLFLIYLCITQILAKSINKFYTNNIK